MSVSMLVLVCNVYKYLIKISNPCVCVYFCSVLNVYLFKYMCIKVSNYLQLYVYVCIL